MLALQSIGQGDFRSYLKDLKSRVESFGADYEVLAEHARNLWNLEQKQKSRNNMSQWAKEQPVLSSLASIPIGLVASENGWKTICTNQRP